MRPASPVPMESDARERVVMQKMWSRNLQAMPGQPWLAQRARGTPQRRESRVGVGESGPPATAVSGATQVPSRLTQVGPVPPLSCEGPFSQGREVAVATIQSLYNLKPNVPNCDGSLAVGRQPRREQV